MHHCHTASHFYHLYGSQQVLYKVFNKTERKALELTRYCFCEDFLSADTSHFLHGVISLMPKVMSRGHISWSGHEHMRVWGRGVGSVTSVVRAQTICGVREGSR